MDVPVSCTVATPTAEIETRARVWAALSDLYLDTDIEGFYDHIVDVLAASPYSREELEHILFREVHPGLYANLLSVAGAWAGFDTHWLTAHLLEVRAQPAWRHCASRLFEGEIRRIWRHLAPRVIERRGRTAAATHFAS